MDLVGLLLKVLWLLGMTAWTLVVLGLALVVWVPLEWLERARARRRARRARRAVERAISAAQESAMADPNRVRKQAVRYGRITPVTDTRMQPPEPPQP